MNFTKIAYNFLPSNGDESVIEIFDAIANKKSFNYWTEKEGSEVTPSDFQEKLNAIATQNIVIRMNSGGGEVNAANVIATAIQEARNAGKHIVCKIVGMCASAAVQIAMSCDEVIAHESALVMIHNPKAFLCSYYDTNGLKSVDNMLTAVKDGILNYYTKKTGMPKDKLSDLMDEEYYMDGKKAVELGFADKLMFEEDSSEDVMNRIHSVVNCCDFKNIPEQYKGTVTNQIQNQITEGAENMEIKNVADLTAKFPELVNQVKNEAVAAARESAVKEGVEQERARLKAIDEMTGKVSNDLLNRAKYETFDTAEKVAVEAIKTGAFNNAGVLAGMRSEGTVTNQVTGAANGGVAAGNPAVDARAHAENIAKNYFQKIGKGGGK